MDTKLLEALIMAHQHFVEQMSYHEVAQRHGISVATVSRRLAEVKEGGLVEEIRRIRPPSKEYEEALYRHVTFEGIGAALLEGLNARGAGLRRVVVAAGNVDPGKEESDADERRDGSLRVDRVGCHGARLLAQHLSALRKDKQGVRVGVNWGYSVQRVCMHFREWCDEDLLAADDVVLSGLSGLFWIDCERDLTLARRSWEVSSAANAQLLASSFERALEMPVYLIRVPAILSQEFRAQQGGHPEAISEVLRLFCRTDPGYRAVYGEKPVLPNADQAEQYLRERWENRGRTQERYGSILNHDIILTGMSALEDSAGIITLSAPELRMQLETIRSRYHACGDIASHVFTETGLIPRKDDPVCPEIGAINARVLSLWPEDLAQVAERHRERGDTVGGTIVLCTGQKKAKALMLALTKLRVANEIVIDTNLAWAMYDLLDMTDAREGDFATARLWESPQDGIG